MSIKPTKKVVMFYINNDADSFTNQVILKGTLDTINLLYADNTNKTDIEYYIQIDSPLYFEEDVVQESVSVSNENFIANQKIKEKYVKWNGCIRFKVEGKTINEDLIRAKNSQYGYIGAIDMATPEAFMEFLQFCKSKSNLPRVSATNIEYYLFVFGHGNGNELIEVKETKASDTLPANVFNQVVDLTVKKSNTGIQIIGGDQENRTDNESYFSDRSRFLQYTTTVDFLSPYLYNKKPNVYIKPNTWKKPSTRWNSNPEPSTTIDSHRLLTIPNLNASIVKVFGDKKLELLCLEGCLLLNIENLYSLKDSCAAVIGSPSYVYYKGFNIGRIGTIPAGTFNPSSIYKALSTFEFLSEDDNQHLGDYKITLVTMGKAFEKLCAEVFDKIEQVKPMQLKKFHEKENAKMVNGKRANKLSLDYFQFADLGMCLNISSANISSCITTVDSFNTKRDREYNIANQYDCPSGVSIFMPYLGDRIREMKQVTQQLEHRYDYVTGIHALKNQLAYLELLTERLTYMFGYYNYFSIPFLLHSKWEERINELNRV